MNSIPTPVLVLEASTSAGSVALFCEGKSPLVRDVQMGVSREDSMLPAIEQLLADAALRAHEVKSIACGAGPGSFTSLRIAAATAKGLCFATGAELYAIPSLLLAAASAGLEGDMIVHSDAMRGERFAQHVSVGTDGKVIAHGQLRRVSIDAIATLASEVPHMRRVAVLSSPAIEAEDAVVTPTASVAMRLNEWMTKCPVDLATWEPLYGRLAEAQVKWEAAHDKPLPDFTRSSSMDSTGSAG